MRYSYFPPQSRQYYFPQDFKRYPLFHSFYQPYTLPGRLAWFCFQQFSVCRWLFSEDQSENTLPLAQIKPYVPNTVILAFNRGTKGAEQKTTILGIDKLNGNEFFIKYAESPVVRNNVRNEGNILSQLSHLDFVPKRQLQIEKDDFIFIQTSVLTGKRLTTQASNQQLLEVLFQLVDAKIQTERNYTTDLQSSLAHGDFCPWNMMIDKEKLNVFDWELAGTYPLGYDLFTWLFQTSFLLQAQKSVSQILKGNEALIKDYFQSQQITNWHPYLSAFAILKLELETQKNNQRLIAPYQQLKHYAENL